MKLTGGDSSFLGGDECFRWRGNFPQGGKRFPLSREWKREREWKKEREWKGGREGNVLFYFALRLIFFTLRRLRGGVRAR